MKPNIQKMINLLFVRYSRLLATILFLLILLILVEVTELREHFTQAFIQRSFENHWIIGVLLFSFLFALGNLIQIPGWIFLGAAVLSLGRVNGGLVTYFAALISCSLTFAIVHFVGGNALRKLESPIAKWCLARLDKFPLGSNVLLRTLFQTAPPLNYTLAISGIKFKPYFLGCLLGLPCPIALYCLFFGYVRSFVI